MNLVLRRPNNAQQPSSPTTSSTLQPEVMRDYAGDDGHDDVSRMMNPTNINKDAIGVDDPLSPTQQQTTSSIPAATIKTMAGLRIRNNSRAAKINEATADSKNNNASAVNATTTALDQSKRSSNSKSSPKSNNTTNRTSPTARLAAVGIIPNKRNTNSSNLEGGPTAVAVENGANVTTSSRRRPHRFAFLRPSSPNSGAVTTANNTPSEPPPPLPPADAAFTGTGSVVVNPKNAPHRAVSAGAAMPSTTAGGAAVSPVPQLLRRLWSSPPPPSARRPLHDDGAARTGEAVATAKSAVPAEGPEATSVSTSSSTTASSSDETTMEKTNRIMSQTQIIPTTTHVMMMPSSPMLPTHHHQKSSSACSASAATILQPASCYLESLCGVHGAAVPDDDGILVFTSQPLHPDDDDNDDDGGGPTTSALCSGVCPDSCPASRRRRHDFMNNNHQHHHLLSDDPTVQESIECVFSSSPLVEQEGGGQLPTILFQNGDLEEDDDDDDDDPEGDDDVDDLVAPSVLQQCLLPNRSAGNKITGSAIRFRKKKKKTKRRESSRLANVGGTTCDPTTESSSLSSPCQTATTEEKLVATAAGLAHTQPRQCACRRQTTPILDRSRWPQFPLLLRPTPGSGTRVTAIRTMTKTLWEANDPDGTTTTGSNLTWPAALGQLWGSTGVNDSNNNNNNSNAADGDGNPMEVMCPQCMVLPINNGNEEPGEALLTDFESEFFVGTLLLRMRHVEGTTREKYNDDKGYFKGMNRRYQAVIRGRFKQEIALTRCMTGFELQRPCGKLPPKWILNGSLKVLSFFAPQLQANLDGERPSSLTPLGSTPQVLALHDEWDTNVTPLEGVQLEPTKSQHTLLGCASDATSSFTRARLRKKQFDKLFIQKSATPKTLLSKVYTFEFLQHLFNFTDFEIELGSMLGAIPLEPILNGQPLQIMALLQKKDGSNKSNGASGGGSSSTDITNRLWSFDVWHESLIDQALQNETASPTGTTRPK